MESGPRFIQESLWLAEQIGQLVNQTELGRDVALAQTTVHRYLNLLATSYLLARLPAYAVNRTQRLIKAPKLYWGDTGVAVHLAGGDAPPAARGRDAPAYLPGRVRPEGPRGPLAAHRQHSRVARARRAGGTVVEGAAKKKRIEVALSLDYER